MSFRFSNMNLASRGSCRTTTMPPSHGNTTCSTTDNGNDNGTMTIVVPTRISCCHHASRGIYHAAAITEEELAGGDDDGHIPPPQPSYSSSKATTASLLFAGILLTFITGYVAGKRHEQNIVGLGVGSPTRTSVVANGNLLVGIVDYEKMDTQAQLGSCDLKGRANKQLCGVGMLTSPWKDLRHLSEEEIIASHLQMSTDLSPDPTCPRSSESFYIANNQRKEGTVRSMTFALLYYEEPQFLSHQIAKWLTWSESTRDKFNFLIVDDGSRPGLKAVDVIAGIKHTLMSYKLDLEIFEIDADLCWNIAGGRNLAVYMSKTEYLYMGDSDTIVEDETARYMLNIKNEDEVAYRSTKKRILYNQFNRIRSDGVTYKPHPAVLVLSKQTYWTAGGCDEDGFFTSGKFRRRAKWAGIQKGNVSDTMIEKDIPPLRELDYEVPCPDILVNCNAMVKFKRENTLPRPEKPDQTLYWKMKFDGTKPWSNEYLRFHWKLVYPSH